MQSPWLRDASWTFGQSLSESGFAKYVDLQDSRRWFDSYAAALFPPAEKRHRDGTTLWDTPLLQGAARNEVALFTVRLAGVEKGIDPIKRLIPQFRVMIFRTVRRFDLGEAS